MKKLVINLLVLLVVVGMLTAACAPALMPTPPSDTPLSAPSVEVIEFTPLPTETATMESIEAPIQTAAVSILTPIVVEQPTAQPTLMIDPRADAANFPPATIQIMLPGPHSSLLSPIVVKANAYPGDQGMVGVQLIGEDGRLMADKLMKMTTPTSGWVSMVTQIPFEILSAGEAALLVVTTRDGYGRRLAQSAIPLLLLQIGRNEIELPGFTKTPFEIEQPHYGDTIKNGLLHVEGYAHPFNANPIVIEMVTQTGGILSAVVVPLPKMAEGQDYVKFAADLPYTVSKRTPVRLTIRQMDERLPAVDISLSSTVISLDP